MTGLGPHAAFIIWSYLGVATAVASLVAYTALDARRVTRRLARLEAQGVRRRSEAKKP